MRTHATPPRSVVGPDATPSYGSFRGSLPPVDLAPLGASPVFRALHHKRWIYLALATDEVLVCAAVVNLGYASNAFVLVLDPARRGMGGDLFFRRTVLVPGPLARVSNHDGLRASIRAPGLTIRFEPRGSGEAELEIRAPGFGRSAEVEATLDLANAPPAVSAIAAVSGGSLVQKGDARLVNATEKRALLPVTGSAVVSGRRYSLRDGQGGLDFTHGYLGRHTVWRWAFGLGRAESGERVAMNLVEGFVGEAECALWVGDELVPVGLGEIRPGANSVLEPWDVRSRDGAVDLRFTPQGLHRDATDLRVIHSKFVQPLGSFEGQLRVPGQGGQVHQVRRMLGVTELQDVLW
jgi:hypothetical protein